MNWINAILFFALSITAFELGNSARSLVSWLPGLGRLSGSHGFLPWTSRKRLKVRCKIFSHGLRRSLSTLCVVTHDSWAWSLGPWSRLFIKTLDHEIEKRGGRFQGNRRRQMAAFRNIKNRHTKLRNQG